MFKVVCKYSCKLLKNHDCCFECTDLQDCNKDPCELNPADCGAIANEEGLKQVKLATILTGAKSLITFLEDRRITEIVTGGNSEDPEVFEFDRSPYGLVAYPGDGLDAAMDQLREAIERSDQRA